MKTFSYRFLHFIHRWQEIYIWFPTMSLFIIAAFYMIPQFDPKAGIDGLGELFQTLIVGAKAMFGVFLAWLFKRTYWRDYTSEQEEKLEAEFAAGNWKSLCLLIKDRLEWCVLLWFAYASLHH